MNASDTWASSDAATGSRPFLPRSAKTDLLLVYAVALGVRFIWAALMPPWVPPDEPSHFTYVMHLVENGELPTKPDPRYPQLAPEIHDLCVATFCGEVSGLGAGKPHLYGLPVEHDYAPALQLEHTPERRKTAAGATASSYPPLYYLVAAGFYRIAHALPIIDRLHFSRAASCALSSLSCVFAYLFAYEIRRSRAWGRCLGLALAMMPMHVFLGASVNNDAAMFATSAAVWWLMARTIFAAELSYRLAAAIGVASGLALLSKPTNSPLVAMAILVVLARVVVSARSSGLTARTGVAVALFLGCLAALQLPWWLHLRESPVSHNPAATSLTQILSGNAVHSLSEYLDYWVGRGWPYTEWLFIKSHWGIFGWLELPMPAGAYAAISIALVVSALGLLASVLMSSERRWIIVGLLAAVVANAAMLIFAADFMMSFASTGAMFGMQGRYFLGTVVPFLFLIASGIGFLAGDRTIVLAAMPLAMAALQGAALTTIVSMYYSLDLQ